MIEHYFGLAELVWTLPKTSITICLDSYILAITEKGGVQGMVKQLFTSAQGCFQSTQRVWVEKVQE